MFGQQFVLPTGGLVLCFLGLPLAFLGASAVVFNQVPH